MIASIDKKAWLIKEQNLGMSSLFLAPHKNVYVRNSFDAQAREGLRCLFEVTGGPRRVNFLPYDIFLYFFYTLSIDKLQKMHIIFQLWRSNIRFSIYSAVMLIFFRIESVLT